MQHDRVTSEVELIVEMEVALGEEVALVDVILRCNRAGSTALWTAWDTAEAIDLDITDFFDVFLFSDKQRTIVPFLSKLISSQ